MAEQKPALSERRMRILNLLNLRKSHKEIAQELGIGVETVRSHIKEIRNALKSTPGEGVVAVVRRAYDQGVLKGPSPLLAAHAKSQRGKKGR